MIELLRERTAKQHQELERVLIPSIKAVNTPESYASLLELFYGYYYPLEQHIAAHMDRTFPGGFELRRKASSILDDIAAIRKAPATQPVCCTDIPEITDNAQALGAMYVLEGSTLGGQVICQMLLRNLQAPELPQALSFFNGYGADTQSYWDTFVHYLQGYNGTEQQQQRMLEAAATTFEKFKLWALSRQGQ
ncbi:biliverdin-producing heme oxygenase [Chitinophaga rhizophila]|uniref:Biliverdin-producing heme oxygenase n=1 Tax=Chitinophaga rhizophila TaxID=2866212 RepID=A0ABS7GMB2_9BACT|nr:biliverdin-producing heme oxygenase [Chitinophaga rhizophila]MBW8688049.1 biliverdin-producing heme oxygenase [Chitinophaga rhizophila]